MRGDVCLAYFVAENPEFLVLVRQFPALPVKISVGPECYSVVQVALYVHQRRDSAVDTGTMLPNQSLLRFKELVTEPGLPSC